MGNSKLKDLKDWWPAADKTPEIDGRWVTTADALSCSREAHHPSSSLSPSSSNSPAASSSSIEPPPTSSIDANLRRSSSQNNLLLSRPCFKITNSKDLKEELLKQLQLQRRPPSSTPPPAAATATTAAAAAEAEEAAAKASSTTTKCSVPAPPPPPPPPPRCSVPVPVPLPSSSSDKDALTCRAPHGGSSSNHLNPTTPSPPAQMPNRQSLSRREIHIYSERERRRSMTHLYATLHSLLPEAKQKADRCTVLTDAIDYIHQLQEQLGELGRQKAEILEAVTEKPEVGEEELEEAVAMAMAGEEEDWVADYEQLGEMELDWYEDDESCRAAAESEELQRRNHRKNKKVKRRRMTADPKMVMISEEARAAAMVAADICLRICSPDAFITLNSPKKKGIWPEILQILDDHNLELLNVTFSTTFDVVYHCIHARISTTASDLRSHELQKMLQDLVLRHFV